MGEGHGSARVDAWAGHVTFALPATPRADTISVPDYASLTDALAAAASGDTVLVTAETVHVTTDQIDIPAGVCLRSLNGRDAHTIYVPQYGIKFAPDVTDPEPSIPEGFTIHDATSGASVKFRNNPDARALDNRIVSLAGGAFSVGGGGGVIHGNEMLCAPFALDRALDINTGAETYLEISSNVILCPGLGLSVYDEKVGSAYVEFRNNTIVHPGYVTQACSWSFVDDVIVVSHNILYGFWIDCYDLSGGASGFSMDYNCIWFSGSSPETDCDLYSWPGNFEADPLFCDISGPSSLDLRLRPDSPCLHGGEGGSLIGALGAGCGVVHVDEAGRAATSLGLRVIPAPVVGRASIAFDESHAGRSAFITIYDVTGRLVVELEAEHSPVTWIRRGKDGTPGVYFVELRASTGARNVQRIVAR